MRNTVIINSHVYTLIPYKTEEELNRMRNACGFGPGYCQCGCEQKTTLHQGTPRKYVHGHNAVGEANANWGGGKFTSGRLTFILAPDHPHANSRGYVQESIFKAVKAIGKALPEKAEIHHVDENSLNNENCNLIVCQDHEYHMLLHYRMKALKATGNARSHYCAICKKWSLPNDPDMYVWIPASGVRKIKCWHRSCRNNLDYKAGRRRPRT
jgi:hypothetical protein